MERSWRTDISVFPGRLLTRKYHEMIMPWTPAQRNRLVAEKSIFDHYFPGSTQGLYESGSLSVWWIFTLNS